MFEGFNESTIRYYQAICRSNCKNTHRENEVLYLAGVKYPLEELYGELYSYFSKVDSGLLSNKRRCISSAYNDARFSSGAPIKEYFYIRFILDNKYYAKEVIEKFNKAGLLEVRGEKYKRAYYPDENAVLQEWLERKRISFVHEEELGSVFYGRDILNCILDAFDSVQDVYFMLKEALKTDDVL